MKFRKYNLFVIAIGFFALHLANQSHAEVQSTVTMTATTKEKKYNVSIDPLATILGVANVGFDFKISSQSTIGFSGAFSTYSHKDHTYTVIGGGLRWDNYLTGEALSDSWYLTPYAKVLPMRVSGDTSESAHPLSLGVLMGYQWM